MDIITTFPLNTARIAEYASTIVNDGLDGMNDAQKDFDLTKLGAYAYGNYLALDTSRGNSLGETPDAIVFSQSGENTPISLSSSALYIASGSFVKLGGVDGYATLQGSDAGMQFKWEGDSPASNKTGFSFDYESQWLVALKNLNLTGDRYYQFADADGTLPSVKAYANNSAAISGGMVAGDIYWNTTSKKLVQI